MPSVNYFLSLGHSPQLSLLELKHLHIDTQAVNSHLVVSKHPQLQTLMSRLGGVTKLLVQLQLTSPTTWQDDLYQLIIANHFKKIAITNYTSLSISSQDLYQLKTRLASSQPTRFLSFKTQAHSLIALRKQHIIELSLISFDSQLVIAQTVWIQDADTWSFRDRRRPYQDIKRGMLPPKIARIMINLATQGQQGTVLDPFCGTGTILMEASLVGNKVIGSDNDPLAIEGAKQNLAWIKADQPRFYLSDATHIQSKLDTVDFIITEPYLGPLLSLRQLPPITKIRNYARGLDKLYRGSLRAWHQLLPQRGRVVMVIPEFHLKKQVISTLKIDTIASLGYNYLDSVAYSKPQATVVRNITILEKTN